MKWKSVLFRGLSGSLRPGKKAELITGREMFGKRQSIGRGTIAGYRMDPKQRMQRLHYTMACAKWGTLSSGDKEEYEAWAAENDVTVYSSFLHAYLEELKTALVLYMPMDKLIDSQITDYSKYANHGTNYNAVLTKGEFIGNCLYFNGTTAYGTCPDDPTLDIDNELTIAVWFNKDLPLGGRIVYKYGTVAKRGYYFTTGALPEDVSLAILADTVEVHGSEEAMPPSTWLHAAGTRKTPGDMNVYINGALSANPVVSPTGTTANEGTFYIGQDLAGGNKLQGYLDEVRIYKKELTIEEIRAMYVLESKWHGDVA